MGLFGLEAFSLSFIPSLVSSVWILIFGAFDIPSENKASAVEALIQGTLSAIRATNSKVTYDPIKRDVFNDKVVAWRRSCSMHRGRIRGSATAIFRMSRDPCVSGLRSRRPGPLRSVRRKSTATFCGGRRGPRRPRRASC